MANTAFQRVEESLARAPFVGPGVVTRARGSQVSLRLPDGRLVEAELALAFGYAPAIGDTLLAIAGDEGHYVIGVISGRGRASLRVGGDLDIASEHGSLRLRAAQAIEVDAPEVTTRAQKVQTFATSVLERAGEWYRAVKDTLTLQAGTAHTIVEGTHHVRAGDHDLVAKNKVRVNGKAIHLG